MRDARKARRDRADDGDTVGLRGRRPTTRRSTRRRRSARREAGARSGVRRGAHRARRALTSTVVAARVAELLDRLDDLPDRLRRVDVDPEELAELAADEHDRDAVDVARSARAARSSRRASRAAPPRRAGSTPPTSSASIAASSDASLLPATASGSRAAPTSAEIDPSGPDDELPGRPEERVEHRRQEERVQAVHGRDPRDLGVRHRRRQGEGGDGQAREEVSACRGRPVPGDLRADRERAFEQRILRARAKRRPAIGDRRRPFGFGFAGLLAHLCAVARGCLSGRSRSRSRVECRRSRTVS